MTSDSLEFPELGLAGPLLGALRALNFKTPTPIQAQAIPPALKGRDFLGIAQTGTGKTAAFVLPVLQHLATNKGRPKPGTARVLILSPTRELAAQIQDSIAGFAKQLRISYTAVYGGVGKAPQAKLCRRGLDILVATPGRLRDLMEDGAIGLQKVDILVLDEADRMLDMGFAPEVRRLAQDMPAERQTILFSATMPNDIAKLAGDLMSDPVRIEVTPQATTVEKIDQKVLFVSRQQKMALLKNTLQTPEAERIIVFTRTKRGADKVCKGLKDAGVKASAIHGDKSQGARKQALSDFTRGRSAVMVATDLAARGIDVDGITHVINYDLPVDAESYVHRIGRTARAGANGIALSFCAPDEVDALKAIQKITRSVLPVDEGHAFHNDEAANTAQQGAGPKPAGGNKPKRKRFRPKPAGGDLQGQNQNSSRKGPGKPRRGRNAKRGSGGKAPWAQRSNKSA